MSRQTESTDKTIKLFSKETEPECHSSWQSGPESSKAFRQSLLFLGFIFEDCPRVARYHTYLVAEASIRDLTYCPQQAKNCSVYSEWNCLRTVIIPTTNGALSI